MTTAAVLLRLLFLQLCLQIFFTSSATAIGVYYRTNADNLPPPSKVASFLKSHTTIDRIRISDTNSTILRAFAGTGISVSVGIPRESIPSLSKLPAAKSWVAEHISPFHPSTKFRYIVVGNEILFWNETSVIKNAVPAMKSLTNAMKSLTNALKLANLTHIKVTTSHSLNILRSTQPPSAAAFKNFEAGKLMKILEFNLKTKTPFMVNPYPFLKVWDGYPDHDYATFRPNKGISDGRIKYTNMLDEMLDAVYVSMKKLDPRFKDIEIVIGETGWPTKGDPTQPGPGLENARSYNWNLVKHVSSGKGTPLMPNRSFETYIFSLFNENLKTYISDQNFGILNPDFSAVYDAGIMRGKHALI
ncbi:Glucan endo-1,3-beta-glucosidase [Linum perenne]